MSNEVQPGDQNASLTVPLVSPDGKVIYTSPEYIRSYKETGYTEDPGALKEALAKQASQKETEGFIPGAESLAEGLGSAATLGVSTEALVGSGLADPKYLKALETNRPVLHGIGAGIGILAPIILSEGADAPTELARQEAKASIEKGLTGTALRDAKIVATGEAVPTTTAKVAQLSAPALINKAGKTASDWVEGALGVDAMDPAARDALGLTHRLAIGGVSGATRGALEGTIYGVGDLIHEDALGDPRSLGDKMGAVGFSALGVGALGGVGSVLGEAGHEYAPHVISALERFRDESFAKALGLKNLTEEQKEILKDATNKGYLGAFPSRESLFDKAQETLATTTEAKTDFINELDNNPANTINLDELIETTRNKLSPLLKKYNDAENIRGAELIKDIQDNKAGTLEKKAASEAKFMKENPDAWAAGKQMEALEKRANQLKEEALAKGSTRYLDAKEQAQLAFDEANEIDKANKVVGFKSHADIPTGNAAKLRENGENWKHMAEEYKEAYLTRNPVTLSPSELDKFHTSAAATDQTTEVTKAVREAFADHLLNNVSADAKKGLQAVLKDHTSAQDLYDFASKIKKRAFAKTGKDDNSNLLGFGLLEHLSAPKAALAYAAKKVYDKYGPGVAGIVAHKLAGFLRGTDPYLSEAIPALHFNGEDVTEPLRAARGAARDKAAGIPGPTGHTGSKSVSADDIKRAQVLEDQAARMDKDGGYHPDVIADIKNKAAILRGEKPFVPPETPKVEEARPKAEKPVPPPGFHLHKDRNGVETNEIWVPKDNPAPPGWEHGGMNSDGTVAYYDPKTTDDYSEKVIGKKITPEVIKRLTYSVTPGMKEREEAEVARASGNEAEAQRLEDLSIKKHFDAMRSTVGKSVERVSIEEAAKGTSSVAGRVKASLPDAHAPVNNQAKSDEPVIGKTVSKGDQLRVQAAELEKQAAELTKVKNDAGQARAAELTAKAEELKEAAEKEEAVQDVLINKAGGLRTIQKTVAATNKDAELNAAALMKDPQKFVSEHTPDFASITNAEVAERIAKYLGMVSDPIKLAKSVQQGVSDMGTVAPKIAIAAAATMTRAATYLAHIAPSIVNETGEELGSNLARADALKWLTAEDAIKHPTKADWSDPTAWGAIQTVYPDMANEFKAMALSQPMTRENQAVLSTLLGSPLRGSLDPAQQALANQIGAQTPPNPIGHHAVGKKGSVRTSIGKSKGARLSATQTQQLIEGDD